MPLCLGLLRPIVGTIREGGFTQDARSHWYVNFQNPPPMHLLKKIEIDIDMGVQSH
jgi:hypothetical protein